MATERQTSWGWQVVADVFVGGVGAALFLTSFLLEKMSEPSALTNLGVLAGPVLVVVGVFFLLVEVGRPTNALRSFLNVGTSWMARGTALQAAMIVSGLAYALLPLALSGFRTGPAGIAVGWLAALLSLVVAAYHGLLFSQARGIALWNNPQLPALYFGSSLAGGAGILMVLSPFLTASGGQIELLVVMEIAIICLVLLALWFMMAVRTNDVYRSAVKKLVTPWFVAITLGVGNLLPLAILIASLVGMPVSAILLAITGAMVLIGAYYLRHGVTRTGHHYSLRTTF